MSPFIRAHGYLPGPTQRPVMSGLLAGLAASAPCLPLAWLSGALVGVGEAMRTGPWLGAAALTMVFTGAGALYGRVFMRAANDRSGGWLFGISYGFLIWMLGPVTLMQWLSGRPILVGGTSQGFFASHLLYGVALGLLFPRIHALIQSRTRE
jgi:hypothetical protein